MCDEGMYQHLSANQIEIEDLPLALDVLKQERGKAMSDIPCLIEIGPEESQESIERRKRIDDLIDDFTRRYPQGFDTYRLPGLPERKPLTRLIPLWLDILRGGGE
jgi:hypothetical protein